MNQSKQRFSIAFDRDFLPINQSTIRNTGAPSIGVKFFFQLDSGHR
ncbi:hypothetical protein [Cycloclasticus pugetii]